MRMYSPRVPDGYGCKKECFSWSAGDLNVKSNRENFSSGGKGDSYG